MRGSIGQLLVQQGVIDASGLADALARQAGRHPLASELYGLGYATERQLTMALSAQTGWTGVVLDESTIRLDVLENVTPEWARMFSALVVHEDATTLVVAAARPEDAIVPARELGLSRNKAVELRIALDITLARTIRVAFTRWRAGELHLVGPESTHRGVAFLASVSPEGEAQDEHRQAQRAIAEEASRSIVAPDELPSEGVGISSTALTSEWQVNTVTQAQGRFDDDRTQVIAEALDRGGGDAGTARIGGPQRALVVDADPPGRLHLMTTLERLGYTSLGAATGAAALEQLGTGRFDLVFVDVATPDIDGLKLCRAIKRSERMRATRVIVTTSVVDSGQIADAVIVEVAADGYLEKPFDLRRLHRVVREPGGEAPDHEVVLGEALRRYHAGDTEGAIAGLRGTLVSDPSSAKLHFMLASMLQRAARWAEAIDEYEAVVELQPAYFPALTRLAYLYFRQGLHARAVETWRRALPVCDDPALRRNIELFMRKLVADMGRGDAGI